MKNKLNELSDEELMKIANHYSLYKPEAMTKKQIVRAILDANGIDIQVKEEKLIKMKHTTGTKLYMFGFSMLIFAILIMTISKYFTTFYFENKISGAKMDPYYLVLSIATFAWSIYVFSSWIKSGTINSFMAVIMLLSVAWFLYFIINYYNQISRLNSMINAQEIVSPTYGIVDFIHAVDIYKTMFYVWVGLISGVLCISGGTFLLKKILY